MAVTFRQLQHFLVLSQELHFGRAAQRLNISQPPLSASLKQLEETLGFQLMDRSNRNVRLTAAGAVFSEHAARILGQLDAARALAEQQAKGAAGTLTVSFVPSMLFRNLPHALRKFEESYPSTGLDLHEMNTTRQIEALQQGEADVGFIHAVPLPPELVSHRIETERLVCCVPRRHRLAGRSRISISEMAGEKVLVFAREFAAHYHDRIVALLRAADVEPYTPYRVQHWFTVVALIAQGMGISLVPYSLSRSSMADVTYIEIEEAHAEHEVHMIWNKDLSSELTGVFTRFVQLHGLERVPSA
ncbi:LysR family transcriptional regulator [Tritonibacter mobilis]|jgi:DNA-binding transcriptional LysR family regulator|uniref:LysR family transcriptional regulator n=1 Tax=Tritonibacter mobilis TaxID=379347 RepID=UPI000D76A98D|nr:LysR family transcriptional regulator [Tritonibacter mobilis]MBU3033850.1 LysR family transcriptional regulator [Tritonibacter mobilis]NKX36720.1 LysR family transcriptional regulator [Rhodobacteraceae bacterium R_SAG4]PXW80244.1 DNA-binding transcriptional LysR family regulator [Ruegeria sp. P4]WHQ84901.1 LysR family transcriptional regulator [Tritonibacter mobilis]